MLLAFNRTLRRANMGWDLCNYESTYVAFKSTLKWCENWCVNGTHFQLLAKFTHLTFYWTIYSQSRAEWSVVFLITIKTLRHSTHNWILNPHNMLRLHTTRIHNGNIKMNEWLFCSNLNVFFSFHWIALIIDHIKIHMR